MKIVLASNNRGKLSELQALLDGLFELEVFLSLAPSKLVS